MTEAELQLLLQLNLNVLQQYIPYLTAQMQVQLAQGIYAGLTPSQILANIESAALSNSQLQTLVTTALNNYSRSVTLGMMNEAPKNTKYIYIGPVDSKTRDICLQQMAASGDGLTQAQIIKRFGSDVLQYAGGYNCRHKWEAMSEFGIDKKFYNPTKAKGLISGSEG